MSDHRLGDSFWFVFWWEIKSTRFVAWKREHGTRLIAALFPFVALRWDANPQFTEWAVRREGIRAYYARFGKLIVSWKIPG